MKTPPIKSNTRQTRPVVKRQFWITCSILACSVAFGTNDANAQGLLIVNGGFETGDFSGWTSNGARDLGVEPTGHLGLPSNSGSYYANFGTFPSTFGTISQTVGDTPGKNYTLSMFLLSDGGGTTFGGPLLNEFQVKWNGTIIYDAINLPAGPYDLLSFGVQGTGTDVVTFSGFDNGSSPGALALDDVNVFPTVPEPSSFALGLVGLGAVAAFYRRRYPN
jgi:hypothetical protein